MNLLRSKNVNIGNRLATEKSTKVREENYTKTLFADMLVCFDLYSKVIKKFS